jgi:hypothetical protein
MLVLEHQRLPSNDCGIASSSKLRFSFASLSEPAVFALSDTNGTYLARVLSLAQPRSDEEIANAAACPQGRLIDFAGNTTSVQFPCDGRLRDGDTAGGCAVGRSPEGGAPWPWLAVAAAAAARRRARRGPSRPAR